MSVGIVRFWAGAKAAAGVDAEPYDAGTLADVIAGLRTRHGEAFGRVLDHCSFLVDDQPATAERAVTVTLSSGAVVDVLPPFAGG